ncbi:MAG: hypothetical protein ACLTGI_10200 [Hoylesella buccalis]
MKPQYIHTQKWNNDGMKDFWIVGLYSDSEKLWKKADIDALTKDECGKYYPDDDTFELWLHWYSPDLRMCGPNNGEPERIALGLKMNEQKEITHTVLSSIATQWAVGELLPMPIGFFYQL